MTIHALTAFTDNYIWMIVNEKKHTFLCIDPGDAAPVIAYAKQNHLSLEHILITHHHADHTNGIASLLNAFPNAQVYGPYDSRLMSVHKPVRDEDMIHLDHFAFRVLSTPGHTNTHLAYQEPTQGWLFCGDTLFSGGCGRVFDGTIEDLHHSILLLKKLPNDTQVYCAHEYTQQNLRFAQYVEPDNEVVRSYLNHLQNQTNPCSLPSTIALEKKINPFMRTTEPNVQAFARAQGLKHPDSLSTFRVLRNAKNVFS